LGHELVIKTHENESESIKLPKPYNEIRSRVPLLKLIALALKSKSNDVLRSNAAIEAQSEQLSLIAKPFRNLTQE
jgi:hypothetical protein